MASLLHQEDRRPPHQARPHCRRLHLSRCSALLFPRLPTSPRRWWYCPFASREGHHRSAVGGGAVNRQPEQTLSVGC